jgi:hypothetical protein
MPSVAAFLLVVCLGDDPIPPLPKDATLALDETWASGRIDPERWYRPRRRWGQGNHGVIPENVRVEQGTVVCEAHGDLYGGPRVGFDGQKDRVGGVLVSKEFYASGRFQISVRLGTPLPKGAVPAVWTYAFRAGSGGRPELLSELDFPEFGKGGVFDKALYNAYCQTEEDTQAFDASSLVDGAFHTLTTEWRTELSPVEGITDAEVAESAGFWWVKDPAVPFARHLGNPLRRLGKDRYALHRGAKAAHWIDGKKVGESARAIPCMAAQLTLGVWLPNWGGSAAWKTSTVAFGPVRVWQYHDAGDVRGVLSEDLKDNFDVEGRPLH